MNLKIQSEMEAKSTVRKTLQLTENGQQLGELIYENLFSLKAEIRLTTSEVYKVEPVGIFGACITVTKNGTEIANLKMNWRGQILLTFQDGHEFVLKAKNMFHDKYVIEDNHNEKLIQLDRKINWRELSYDYDITCDKKPPDILLVLLGIYASNYFVATMAGVTAGIA